MFSSQHKSVVQSQEKLSSLNKRKTQLDTIIKNLKVEAQKKEKEISGESVYTFLSVQLCPWVVMRNTGNISVVLCGK